jgi:hypothetical protein
VSWTPGEKVLAVSAWFNLMFLFEYDQSMGFSTAVSRQDTARNDCLHKLIYNMKKICAFMSASASNWTENKSNFIVAYIFCPISILVYNIV